MGEVRPPRDIQEPLRASGFRAQPPGPSRVQPYGDLNPLAPVRDVFGPGIGRVLVAVGTADPADGLHSRWSDKRHQMAPRQNRTCDLRD